jgi:hypothetical protein
MIGKPHWFTYRVFGWGIAPKTWQGFAYVTAAAGIIGGATALTARSAAMPWVAGGLIALLVIDVLHIMMQLPKVRDERENYHQLLVERNCSFAAVIALASIVLYQTYQNRGMLSGTGTPFDVSLLVVLGAMLLAKVGTTLYLKMNA